MEREARLISAACGLIAVVAVVAMAVTAMRPTASVVTQADPLGAIGETMIAYRLLHAGNADWRDDEGQAAHAMRPVTERLAAGGDPAAALRAGLAEVASAGLLGADGSVIGAVPATLLDRLLADVPQDPDGSAARFAVTVVEIVQSDGA